MQFELVQDYLSLQLPYIFILIYFTFHFLICNSKLTMNVGIIPSNCFQIIVLPNWQTSIWCFCLNYCSLLYFSCKFISILAQQKRNFFIFKIISSNMCKLANHASPHAYCFRPFCLPSFVNWLVSLMSIDNCLQLKFEGVGDLSKKSLSGNFVGSS